MDILKSKFAPVCNVILNFCFSNSMNVSGHSASETHSSVGRFVQAAKGPRLGCQGPKAWLLERMPAWIYNVPDRKTGPKRSSSLGT